MNLSPAAELIGTVPHPVAITGGGTDVQLAITPDGLKKLSATHSAATDAIAKGHIYLALENILGTRDATILKIYVSFREDALRDDRLLTGSVSLFGLRRASAGKGDNKGAGLDILLDITPTVTGVPAVKAGESYEMRIGIVPEAELPGSSDIVIGKISLYLEKNG
nr:hypothetical protein [uncultured Dyadobacter sp.]